MTDETAREIIEKLDRIIAYFEGSVPGEVRRRAKHDVVAYLQKHKIGVSGEHGRAGEGKGKVRHRR